MANDVAARIPFTSTLCLQQMLIAAVRPSWGRPLGFAMHGHTRTHALTHARTHARTHAFMQAGAALRAATATQVHSVPLVLRIGHAAPDGHSFVPDTSDLITKMYATDRLTSKRIRPFLLSVIP